MKRSMSMAVVAIAMSAAIHFGCSPEPEHPHVASETQTAPQVGTTDADTAVERSTAMIDWCIVSGEPLGAMGNPVNYKYKDREIQFCCKQCIKEFEANPIVYLERLDSAQAGLIGPPVKPGS